MFLRSRMVWCLLAPAVALSAPAPAVALPAPAAPVALSAPAAPVALSALGPAVAEVPAGAGNGRPVGATVADLAARGYQEREFLMTGRAETYQKVGVWTGGGQWGARATGTTQSYTTRLLVERPADPARFNGTVVVEWLNVSFGVDIGVEWSQSYEHFTRAGYAYVGVTTQKVGADKLRSLDPARYGQVSLASDALSYSIFAQAAEAVRANAPALLGTGAPAKVLAAGHSQSAGRLATFANAIQPIVPTYDGILIHGRGAGAAPIGDGLISLPLTARIRTDTAVPVLQIESETDIRTFSDARQADSARVRTWEVAGTSHADAYGLAQYNAQNARDRAINDGRPISCDRPVNAMTWRYASNAAYHHLDRWSRGLGAPPAGPQISLLLGSVRRDGDGNALGGVRLPDLDAPLAAYAPTNSGGEVAGACLLLGATTGLSSARIRQLYPAQQDYVAAFTRAADRALAAGHLLPADHAEAVARARATPLP
ncbi:alpha/beta hydrolase domain-containing protein [Nonomuraea sp. PA05]|uniref:alpha/beta hydrolase domain-containing protein n=1 Tax=Nonomuraea sp. PA05 TaxID=2604466 RepID=UPI0021CC9F2F|nr:alpha/beta hydrolase domain-containing protein [Nonomuraea sp. PA05]